MTTVTTTATVVTTTTTAAATKSSTTSASAARGLLLRLVHRERPATDLSPVQSSDSGLGIALARHFDEGKAPRPSRIPVGDDLHISDLATSLFEERTELRCVHVKREITDIHSCPHTVETPFIGLWPTPDG
jgi:hypothetical protein